jgi:hypothetical protein
MLTLGVMFTCFGDADATTAAVEVATGFDLYRMFIVFGVALATVKLCELMCQLYKYCATGDRMPIWNLLRSQLSARIKLATSVITNKHKCPASKNSQCQTRAIYIQTHKLRKHTKIQEHSPR